MATVRVCGSDLGLFREGMAAVPGPLVPGHEFGGRLDNGAFVMVDPVEARRSATLAAGARAAAARLEGLLEVVFDAPGAEGTRTEALNCTMLGGTVALLGVHDDRLPASAAAWADQDDDCVLGLRKTKAGEREPASGDVAARNRQQLVPLGLRIGHGGSAGQAFLHQRTQSPRMLLTLVLADEIAHVFAGAAVLAGGDAFGHIGAHGIREGDVHRGCRAHAGIVSVLAMVGNSIGAGWGP
jgi:hypothetical protein